MPTSVGMQKAVVRGNTKNMHRKVEEEKLFTHKNGSNTTVKVKFMELKKRQILKEEWNNSNKTNSVKLEKGGPV